MLPLKTYIQKPRVLLSSLLVHYGFWIPDKWYLKMLYPLKTGERLDLSRPQTFGEKLQWLKLYNRKREYTMMADKYSVKKYVASVIGEEYVIPTLGVWDRPENIDFDALPTQFVLKTTHGGGSCGVIVCKDKSQLNIKKTVLSLRKAMRQNIYRAWREWPYKDVKRRIIAEECLDNHGEELKDYKFFCFNGIPEYCQVISGRDDVMSIDFFDGEWTHQPFHEPKNYPFSQQDIASPTSLQMMLALSRKLSAGFPFIRVDFYEMNGHPYFGELTFFPTSGVGGFSPKEWNYILGDLIKLPSSLS